MDACRLYRETERRYSLIPKTRRMARFPHLFQPIEIGRMTVKNRLFIPGHNTALSVKGLVSDEMIAYHEARAEAGVGMITMEVSTVHPSYAPHGRLSVVTDDCIPGLERMAAMGKRHDCRVLGQLFHPGRVAAASEDGSTMASYAPSEVPDEFYKNVPAPLTTDQVWDLVDHYRLGAARMAEGGLDGIELISSMGYLISQFLNPRLNRRTDEFGGSLENRLRFLREVIAAVRKGAGDEIVVGIRSPPMRWMAKGSGRARRSKPLRRSKPTASWTTSTSSLRRRPHTRAGSTSFRTW